MNGNEDDCKVSWVQMSGASVCDGGGGCESCNGIGSVQEDDGE